MPRRLVRAAGPSRRRRRRRSRATAPSPRARRRRRRPRWPPGRRRPRRPACRPAARSRRRPRAVTVPVTSGPSNVGGSQAGGIPSAASDLGRPVARGEVEQDRAGAVGLVDGVLAGQAQPQVVLGQQDVGGPRPHVGLVVADPDELRGGEAGQGVVAGDRDQPLRPDRGADRVALGRGPLVVPEDRRPEHAVGVVEQHQPVHLAGQPDRDDVVARHARRRPGPTRSPPRRRPTRLPGPARSRAGAAR